MQPIPPKKPAWPMIVLLIAVAVVHGYLALMLYGFADTDTLQSHIRWPLLFAWGAGILCSIGLYSRWRWWIILICGICTIVGWQAAFTVEQWW
jgi:hypothetical protein